MHIEVNTDHNITADAATRDEVSGVVASSLARFGERITRVEVHLNDVNSAKGGADDKRCMLEARLAGREPVAVTHTAPAIDLALDGATDKLVKALDSALGRMAAQQAAPSAGEVASDPDLLKGSREVI